MAVTYGFYNSLEGDRKYSAEQMGAMFDGLIKDGVFSTWGNHFQVQANGGNTMGIVVRSGKAWFDNTWTINDRDMTFNLAAANTLNPRIDAVVLEVDKRTTVRANQIFVTTGIPKSSPERPVMYDLDGKKWYPLAYITVKANATYITQADIQSVVGTDTPYVTGLLEQADLTSLYEGWDNQFNTWFNDIQTQLAGDVAANLQKQVTELKTKVDTFKGVEKASDTDITYGNDVEKYVNPSQLVTKINNLALTPSKKASTTEAAAGSSNEKYITPYTLKYALQQAGGSGFTLTQGSISIVTYEEYWQRQSYGNQFCFAPPDDLVAGTGLKWSSNSMIRVVPRTKPTAVCQAYAGIQFMSKASGTSVGDFYIFAQDDPGTQLNLVWDVYILTPN